MPTLDLVWYEAELAGERERNRAAAADQPIRQTLASLLFRGRNELPAPCKTVAIAVAVSGS